MLYIGITNLKTWTHVIWSKTKCFKGLVHETNNWKYEITFVGLGGKRGWCYKVINQWHQMFILLFELFVMNQII